MKTYRITWIEVATGNAACIGLDETIRGSDYTPEETLAAAIEHGVCLGVDLMRHHPIIEDITPCGFGDA